MRPTTKKWLVGGGIGVAALFVGYEVLHRRHPLPAGGHHEKRHHEKKHHEKHENARGEYGEHRHHHHHG